MHNPNLPLEAEIVERHQDGPDIFTLRLCFTDPKLHKRYQFKAGQFNMIYLYGVGEVAISIVSDPQDETLYDHTIRVVGRVTRAMARLKVGDKLGIRGPFGKGWPMREAEGKDVVIITGGLGCAPTVSVIHYIERRREKYGQLYIIQGVKHSNDLIYREKYKAWQKLPDTTLFLAASQEAKAHHDWYSGYVTDLISELKFKDSQNVVAMMCGPEAMMVSAMKEFEKIGINDQQLFLSMERSMHCATGHCGHCQLGGKFICRDGPVFSYQDVKTLLKTAHL